MANIRINALGADADGHIDKDADYLVLDGATTRKIRPPVMTAAQFGTGTDTNPKFVPANALATAARWIGAFVTGTVRRIGTIFTSDNGTYIVHTELAANVAEAGARTSSTRIDRPPDMTDAHVTGGSDQTRSVPHAKNLKDSVDTHAAKAIRSVAGTGSNTNNGIKFTVLTQMQYNALTAENADPAVDANTAYFITG